MCFDTCALTHPHNIGSEHELALSASTAGGQGTYQVNYVYTCTSSSQNLKAGLCNLSQGWVGGKGWGDGGRGGARGEYKVLQQPIHNTVVFAPCICDTDSTDVWTLMIYMHSMPRVLGMSQPYRTRQQP